MRLHLRHINHVLFTTILVVNAYIIAAPFSPRVTFWWQSHHTHLKQRLVTRIKHPAEQTYQPNGLIIPAMLLNQPTLEAPESDWFNALKAGIWHWPASSTPDKGGNTVFLAHRFSYTGPHGAFYYLDKLQVGDEIGVVWNNKSYIYSVVSSQVVPATDVAIENQTSDARLTLFTCTPLWHPVDRLVVVAKLESKS